MCRIELLPLKNSSVSNQSLVIFPNFFHPPPPILPHNTQAALMGPDDHRHSEGQAGYGSLGQRCPWRAESLSMFRPDPARERRPRQNRAFLHAKRARMASHTSIQVSTQTEELHALDLPETVNVQTGNGAWK